MVKGFCNTNLTNKRWCWAPIVHSQTWKYSETNFQPLHYNTYYFRIDLSFYLFPWLLRWQNGLSRDGHWWVVSGPAVSSCDTRSNHTWANIWAYRKHALAVRWRDFPALQPSEGSQKMENINAAKRRRRPKHISRKFEQVAFIALYVCYWSCSRCASMEAEQRWLRVSLQEGKLWLLHWRETEKLADSTLRVWGSGSRG